MILTCPECATSYFVDDARIPPEGRTVKCASCGARWRAERPAAEPSGPDDEPEIFQAVGDEPPNTYEPPGPPDAADEAVVDVEAAADTGLRKRPAAAVAAAARRAPAKPVGGGGGVGLWIGMAAVVAVLVGGALLFRQNLVQMWPQSSAAFAGLGLKVDGTGLVIEGIKAEPNFLGGLPVLAVTGTIRNIRAQPMTSPAIRISLLDRAGKPVAAKVARPLDAQIPAHAERHFAVAVIDPPANAHDLEVTFEGADAKSAQAGAVRPAAPGGPAPVDAQPLPPGAPDALPDHG